MVARAVVGIPTLLCLWITQIIASLPGRRAVTVLEPLTGTMLTGSGSISQAILAVPCRRQWSMPYAASCSGSSRPSAASWSATIP